MDKNQEGEVEEKEFLCAKKKKLANIFMCVYVYKYFKNTHIECIYIKAVLLSSFDIGIKG